jgi:hypothetical protein
MEAELCQLTPWHRHLADEHGLEAHATGAPYNDFSMVF